MRLAASVLLFAAITVVAQGPPSGDGRFRKELLTNDRLSAYLVEIPPQQSTSTHRHDHDALAVYVSGGSTKVKTDDKSPVVSKVSAGEVFLHPAPFTHTVENVGKEPFRVVDIELVDPAGAVEKPARKKSHYCNPGSKTACVTEEYLTCTTKFCIEDVTMGPGAKSSRHTHDTEHMLVAITDYTLDDDIVGKGVTKRDVKSGGVEYLPSGITHVLTNTSSGTVRFVAIIFR